jgi:hypothetical protein
MYDVVTPYLSDERIRDISVWMLSLSALIIFFFAFAVSVGAGVHSPLAICKTLQRFFYCVLSVACAYLAACIAYFGWTPPGPILILFVAFSISTMLSAVRHIFGPLLVEHDNWRDVWRAIVQWHGGPILRSLLHYHPTRPTVDRR